MEFQKTGLEQETLTNKLINQMREDILCQRIPAGSHISVKEISERYNVSNMPVREALFALASERLIEMSPYKGARVLSVDKNFIVDLYEFVGAIEVLLVESALPYITEADIERLRETNAMIGAVGDTDFGRQEYLRLNQIFHYTIYDKSPNSFARDQYEHYHQFIRVLWKRYKKTADRIRQVYQEHLDLIKTIEERDVDTMRNAIWQHVHHAKDNFLQQYDS